MLPAQPLLLASMLLSVSGIPVNGGTQVRADDPMAAHLASLSVGFSGACSGVIVGEDTILTAAHCSDINSVSFGVDRYQPVASAQVEKVVVNPGYVEDGTDRNDIAWVKLASKIPGAFPRQFCPTTPRSSSTRDPLSSPTDTDRADPKVRSRRSVFPSKEFRPLDAKSRLSRAPLGASATAIPAGPLF